MSPKPKRNNGQGQSLTVLLRNIISEYPGGGGVLRELCQNADDAGADAIEFVLDTRQHPTENLLHEDLAKFQGVSILAYNNKPFTEKDFESLMRIGDSIKVTDLTSTGKFGRGFNSVYNWTDGPSMISGTSLLWLDPHKSWSSEIGFPGGPLYDFVADSNEPEINNQLHAFRSVLKSYDTGFQGTIIRLPLRNEDQAKKSEIHQLPTSKQDIEDAFQLFANELPESLLFLRNLRSITLRIDDNILAKAKSTIRNERENEKGENPVNEGYRQVFVEKSKEYYESNFMMTISITRGAEPNPTSETEVKYAISHHLRKPAEGENLQIWARGHKLFPWVAIANPLDKIPDFDGRLFATLPLPIRTKHPAHIHGIFSITPDRSNIHSGGDTTMSENSATRLGARWNQWLLHECVPHAWVRNLEFMRSENLSPSWDSWPAGKQGECGQLWMGIFGAVFKKVVEDGLGLLPTVSGVVKPAKEVTFTLGIPEDLHLSLRDAGVQVLFPPTDRRAEISTLDHKNMGLEYLSHFTARRHLTSIKNSNALQRLDINLRMVLLDYILSDCQVQDFKNCEAPLIPLSDGTFQGFEMAASRDDRILIARDKTEEALFQKSTKRKVKTCALSEKSWATLVRLFPEVEEHTGIKTWSVEDAAQYCSSCEFDGIMEPTPVVKIDKPGFSNFIELFWEWISKAQHSGTEKSTLVNVLKDLWLIPLGNQMFQRIGTTSKYPVLDVSVNKGIGSFLKQAESALINRFGLEIMYLYSGGNFPHATKSLQDLGLIKDYDDRVSLMKWLEVTMKVFPEKLDHDEKRELIRHLFGLARGSTASETSCMEQTVRKLPIFQKATDSDQDKRGRWLSIANNDTDSLTTYIGVGELPITLDTPQHTFIDTGYHELKELETGKPNDKRRMKFIRFTFDNFKSLPDEARSALPVKEIVPVSTEKLRRPEDSVSGQHVTALYFDDEERCPIKEFDEAYHETLVRLGMPEDTTDQVILERIYSYSSSGRSNRMINDKVSTLFLSCGPPTDPLSKECLGLSWIPATSLEGKPALFSPLQCRSTRFQSLCNYSMPIAEFHICQAWEKWLGWDRELTVEHMSKQLQGAKRKCDHLALASLVEYWYEIWLLVGAGLTVDTEMELDSQKWVPGSSGGFFSPTEIFFTGAAHLPPYYDQVWGGFLGAKPNLKELQDRIATVGPLSTRDLEVALYIVEQVAERHNSEKGQNLISDFKAPDQYGVMRTFLELTTTDSDALISQVNGPTLHPRISDSTAKNLGLPTVGDRILASLNDQCFEQAFSQARSLQATIKDTLRWYSVDSSFREYLANAEDCMDKEGKTATRIDWIIDHSTNYPTYLVFTHEDFKSIIDVGIGSKGLDYSKIGKFGKGALTMYYWTSAPSFVSGDFYVTFE
ncbi:hypothetical protein HOY82DRAFT_632883 [Tuber indicum]|nr:hypothetical protein HOY82DRAFT_632883 [Tuber indicum]